MTTCVSIFFLVDAGKISVMFRQNQFSVCKLDSIFSNFSEVTVQSCRKTSSLLCHFVAYCFLGLKKVTDDMKTHKNPSLRNQGPVATTKSSALNPRPYSPPQFKKFNAPGKDKPPVFELQMKKWVVVSFTLVSLDDIDCFKP